MGCFCSKHAHVLDEGFEVMNLSPKEIINFLTSHQNWLTIIPGCEDGVVTDVLGATAAAEAYSTLSEGEKMYIESSQVLEQWEVQGRTMLYVFTKTRRDSEEKSEWLLYSVHVRGTSSGLPVDFTFDVRYEFVRPYGAAPGFEEKNVTHVRRLVTNLMINKCTCIMGCVIKSSLISGCRKENVTMVEMMVENPAGRNPVAE